MKKPFEQVVSEHGAMVLRVCRAVLGPHTDADDAWSETFLAALRAYPELPADANLEAWLVTVAHRKSIDLTRGAKRRAILVADVSDGVLPDGAVLSTFSTVGVPGSHDHDLWDAVGALPDKQRQAVAYHYVAGLPYKEVAQVLGGSTDAARRAASDGVKQLRRHYR